MESETEGAVEAPVVETEAAPELAESQEVEPVAPASTDSQLYTVKVGGEEIQVPLEEALNGYMRNADYTQKTQAVAAQREELNYAEQIAQALESNPEATIQALVQAYGIEGFQPPAQASPEPAEPQDPEEAFKSRVEAKLAELEMREFEQKVNADLSEMHQRYGKFDDAEVIQYAVERGIPDIIEATKAFVSDRVWSSAQKQVAERHTQERKAALPPVAGGRGTASGATTPGGVSPFPSFDEAFEQAMQSHGHAR